jgi:hypothetical protein
MLGQGIATPPYGSVKASWPATALTQHSQNGTLHPRQHSAMEFAMKRYLVGS